LSYTPAKGGWQTKRRFQERQVLLGDLILWKIRAADAKEVGVGNPAEETCCYPNKINLTFPKLFVNSYRPSISVSVASKNLLALRRRFFQ